MQQFLSKIIFIKINQISQTQLVDRYSYTEKLIIKCINEQQNHQSLKLFQNIFQELQQQNLLDLSELMACYQVSFNINNLELRLASQTIYVMQMIKEQLYVGQLQMHINILQQSQFQNKSFILKFIINNLLDPQFYQKFSNHSIETILDKQKDNILNLILQCINIQYEEKSQILDVQFKKFNQLQLYFYKQYFNEIVQQTLNNLCDENIMFCLSVCLFVEPQQLTKQFVNIFSFIEQLLKNKGLYLYIIEFLSNFLYKVIMQVKQDEIRVQTILQTLTLLYNRCQIEIILEIFIRILKQTEVENVQQVLDSIGIHILQISLVEKKYGMIYDYLMNIINMFKVKQVNLNNNIQLVQQLILFQQNNDNTKTISLVVSLLRFKRLEILLANFLLNILHQQSFDLELNKENVETLCELIGNVRNLTRIFLLQDVYQFINLIISLYNASPQIMLTLALNFHPYLQEGQLEFCLKDQPQHIINYVFKISGQQQILYIINEQYSIFQIIVENALYKDETLVQKIQDTQLQKLLRYFQRVYLHRQQFWENKLLNALKANTLLLLTQIKTFSKQLLKTNNQIYYDIYLQLLTDIRDTLHVIFSTQQKYDEQLILKFLDLTQELLKYIQFFNTGLTYKQTYDIHLQVAWIESI